jgi:putative transcriptional regulator
MRMVSEDAAEYATLLASLEGSLEAVAPSAALRAQVLDLARAPKGPIDPSLYRWLEIAPGVKVHVLEEDRERSMRACLIWAKPGARHPRHRHHGDENVLVLQGTFKDDRGTYGPGDVCRSRAGSDHAEEAVGGEDCVCYVVYYGALEHI